MSYESTAEPIKVGYLFDFRLPDGFPPAGAGEDAACRGRCPGTRVSFGTWTRRAWMGAGYLVARQLDPDGASSRLVARFGED